MPDWEHKAQSGSQNFASDITSRLPSIRAILMFCDSDDGQVIVGQSRGGRDDLTEFYEMLLNEYLPEALKALKS